MDKIALPVDEIQGFLASHHECGLVDIEDLEPLTGGLWSSAFGYRVGDQELVVRFSDTADGFRSDRSAMAFDGPQLPVPDVIHIGEALGHHSAISVRHHGRFLENITDADAEHAGPMIVGLLDALRTAPVGDHETDSHEADNWRRWLRSGLVDDDPTRLVSGWRPMIAANPGVDRVFRACVERVDDLLDACTGRRDLVHADLLHQNVLISDDASRVNAVFSWKHATRGDFLYDAAFFTFWAPWFPSVGAVDVWGRLTRDPERHHALVDAPQRHHCYELQIGASHLGWYVWSENETELERATARLSTVLERGPLTM